MSDDWLDKFRDDRPKPKPKSSEPGWLGRFRDNSKQGAPRNEPRRAPPAQPATPPRGRPMPRNAPPPQAGPQSSTQPLPQPRPRPPEAPPQPQAQRGLWGRPQDVLVFASLMALSLALGLSTTALALPRLMEIASPLEILLPDILVIAVTGGFVYLVAGLRQSWAVWLLIVFCIVRFALYVPTFFHINSVTVRMLTAMYFILQAAALWFVFTPAAKRWLRAARNAARK